MSLTSLTVWSVTPPGGKTDVASSTDWGTEAALDPSAPSFAKASFQAGTLLTMDGRLGHARLAADGENETYLFVDVKADPGSVSSTPAPLNLSIVIDRSASSTSRSIAG